MSWPGTLRVMGLLLGCGELVNWAISGQAPIGGVMTFAAGLIAAPNAAVVQQDRNRRREIDRSRARSQSRRKK